MCVAFDSKAGILYFGAGCDKKGNLLGPRTTYCGWMHFVWSKEIPVHRIMQRGFVIMAKHCRLEIVTNCNEASIIMCVGLLYGEKHFKGLNALPSA